MLKLTSHLLNNLGYVIAIAYFLSKLKGFQQVMGEEKFSKRNVLFLSTVFSAVAILGTYIGIDYQGSIANTRNIGVVVAGFLGGPLVGTITGLIAGLHRLLIDIGGITSLPCAIATISGGILSGFLHKKASPQNRYLLGFIGGIIVENFSMGLILLMSKPTATAVNIVQNIYVPMVVANAVGVSIVILITESIQDEKERLAGEQAKLAIEIANKTMPFFRGTDENSLSNVCRVISESLNADIVVITDTENITALYSKNDEFQITQSKIVSIATKEVLKTGEVITCDKKSDLANFRGCDYIENIKSAVIAPLKEGNDVIGTLKIYFKENKKLSSANKNLAIGLSQLISTQLEISKIEQLKETAIRSEIKALQAQINPHFLFNALHTITSFVRIDPDKARNIIIDLSKYLRYNLEKGEQLVDIDRELEQVQAYVNIEQARFNRRFNVHYNVDEKVKTFKIPSLTIQPLVENAIKHGILKNNSGENVYISLHKTSDECKIIIEDDGCGISDEVIEKVYANNMEYNRIGLFNVHRRLKLIYGHGLEIEKTNPGTRMSFFIN